MCRLSRAGWVFETAMDTCVTGGGIVRGRRGFYRTPAALKPQPCTRGERGNDGKCRVEAVLPRTRAGEYLFGVSLLAVSFTPEYAPPLAAREPVIGESRGLPSG